MPVAGAVAYIKCLRMGLFHDCSKNEKALWDCYAEKGVRASYAHRSMRCNVVSWSLTDGLILVTRRGSRAAIGSHSFDSLRRNEKFFAVMFVVDTVHANRPMLSGGSLPVRKSQAWSSGSKLLSRGSLLVRKSQASSSGSKLCMFTCTSVEFLVRPTLCTPATASPCIIEKSSHFADQQAIFFEIVRVQARVTRATAPICSNPLD